MVHLRRAVLLALTLAVGACSPAADAPSAGSFTRVSVLRDFAVERGAWEVLEHPPGGAPHPQVLTPAVSIETDSADKPSICMPPPGRVRLSVPSDLEGPLFLRASAGIGRRTRARLPREVSSITVGFDLLVDGQPAFSTEITSGRARPGEAWDPSRWVWHNAGDGAGVPVRPGSVVELATRWVDPPPDVAPPLPPEALAVGFGGVFLERRTETPRTTAEPDAPNLVLVVMDTLRADRLSCYGNPRATSPHLDGLAARGLRFDNAFSTASWTFPSTASLFTGLPPEAHGVVSNESCTLAMGCTTLAEVLQERGLTTGAFCANPLIAPDRYFDQGFETFVVAPGGGTRPSEEIVPQALEWLDRNAGRRFFLYLHLTDPHAPYRAHPEELARLGVGAPPPGWPAGGLAAFPHVDQQPHGGLDDAQLAYAEAVYDACVATGDRWFGAVLDRLDALGLTDRTVVAFTADHGEELFDRGALGHGQGVHRELVRVPLVLAGPGLPCGVVARGDVGNLRVGATLALLGGAELDPLGEGRALLGDPGPEPVAYSTHKAQWMWGPHQVFGLRDAGWLVLWSGVAATPGEHLRLFDLAADPGEREDLAAREPKRAEAMRQALALRLQRERGLRPEMVLGAGQGGMEALIELGYVDAPRAEEGDEDAPRAKGGEEDGR